jgi:nucleoside-diphosphate-sugar epimerase
MRLLILGGTRFLGRAIAAHACAAGHDVTCAARGVGGVVPDGARFVRVDRDEPDGLAPLADKEFDAVVDVSRHPGQVRRAVAALRRRVGHWTLVSTVSVYADNRSTGQRADTAHLRAPTAPEIDHSTEETYPPRSRASRRSVRTRLFAGPD